MEKPEKANVVINRTIEKPIVTTTPPAYKPKEPVPAAKTLFD